LLYPRRGRKATVGSITQGWLDEAVPRSADVLAKQHAAELVAISSTRLRVEA
jgi:hypothetical protein